jgi:hypothetical protein
MDKKNHYIITAPIDWVSGYLRYGHKEMMVHCSEEELQKLLTNPKELLQDADTVVDDYRIEDYGDINYDAIEVTKVEMD